MLKIPVLALALSLAAFLIAAGSYAAQKTPCSQDSPFGSMDTDKDGKISRSEYLKGWTNQDLAGKNFDALDQDGDGCLTEADRQALIKKIDSNKDGKIALKEYLDMSPNKKEAKDEFKRMDLDRDGYLSDDETMGRWPTITILSW